MNQYVPNWNLEDHSGHLGDILPMENQKKPMGLDNELVELLWQDGHVAMHSHNHRKASAINDEFKPVQEPEPAEQCKQSLASTTNSIQADETVSWFQYPPFDDPLEKLFCSEFFSEMAGIGVTSPNKMSNNGFAEEERDVKFGATSGSNSYSASAPRRSTLRIQEETMPPSKPQGCKRQASCLGNGNFSHFGSWRGKLGEKGSGSGTKVGGQGTSIYGSNQICRQSDPSIDAAGVVGGSKQDSVQKHVCETTLTSSSGGSDCTVRRRGEQGESNRSQKRRKRDVEDPEYQSEEAEHELMVAKKPAQRSISNRRSRAAEVHNLSERRRRDRINEKMKALQQLIPRCNKTDKASMLDEAIEYLKSLQLQVQMMWMGNGMAHMMFPGVQQYISGMGMGTSHAPLHHAVQLPSVPVANLSATSSSTTNQRLLCSSPALHAVNFQNQIQSHHLQGSYAPFLGFHHVQPHSQAMNPRTFGSHIVQQNQPSVTPSSSIIPCAGQAPCENKQDSTSG